MSTMHDEVCREQVRSAQRTSRLPGHVAVVTGGNGGIGLALASGLAEAGAKVAIWGTNPDKNDRARVRLEMLTDHVHVERCDVSDEMQVVSSFQRTIEVFGRVDSVFANAAINTMAKSFVDLSLADWRRVLAVNLDGTFLTLREGALQMVERGEGGSLVAVSSTTAIHGAPLSPHYGASKSGILGLVRAAAVGLARHRIRVNALLPGWTDTDLTAVGKNNPEFLEATTRRTPARRWADPGEFEAVAAFLADPSMTFHTGDCMVMDGGYTIF